MTVTATLFLVMAIMHLLRIIFGYFGFTQNR
jgi:hypothetical protein